MLVVITEEWSSISRTITQRQEVYFHGEAYDGENGEIKALDWAKTCRPFPPPFHPESTVLKIWTERRD